MYKMSMTNALTLVPSVPSESRLLSLIEERGRLRKRLHRVMQQIEHEVSLFPPHPKWPPHLGPMPVDFWDWTDDEFDQFFLSIELDCIGDPK